jgi:heme oxygenase
LRTETAALHAEAERAGVMRELLRDRLERGAYCVLLRNLHEIYTWLEHGLDRHAAHPLVSAVDLPGLRRRGALAADLQSIHGEGWDRLPRANATTRYASRLRELGDRRAEPLVAHAYVRYLGDLSGGQILRRIVADSLRLADGVGTAFYDFGDEAGLLADTFRSRLDALDADGPVAGDIVAEAQRAFVFHVRLFEAQRPQR